MRRLLLVLVCFSSVFGRRCLPFKYVSNGSKCGDNTRPEGFYCGVGKCRLLGTWCKGGCRNADGLAPLKKGDVVICTRSGPWKGSLAVNQTHVVYPVFGKGFTQIVQDFKSATSSRLGHYCRVETSMFDYYAHLLGFSSRSDFLQTSVNIFSKSWEFQVTYWKYGMAFSPSELMEDFGEFKEEFKI